MRLIRIIGVALAVLLQVLVICVYLVLPSMLPHAIVYAPNSKSDVDVAADPKAEELRRIGVTRHLRVDVGPPAASLSVYWIEAKMPAKGSVILLHGIGDRKESLLNAAKSWAARGYQAFLLDHRGHGRSTGGKLTFGVVESTDVKQVIDRVTQAGLLKRPLGLLGFSFGGAVAIQTAAKDPRVASVISVSTFASLRKVLANYVATYVPVVGGLLTPVQVRAAAKQAGELAGFDASLADTVAAARRLKVPALILHGADDRKISPEHAREIAAASTRSKLVIVKGADHDSIMQDPNGEVGRACDAWFSSHLR